MTIVAALAYTGAMLAMAAGLTKLVSPRGAVTAMRAMLLPSSSTLVRAGAVVELTCGALVLAWDSWLPRLLLASAYVGFAIFSLAVLRSERDVPCGCFGPGGATPGWRHVSLDVVLAIALVAFGAERLPSALGLVRESAPLGVATVAVVAVASLLAATFLSGSETARAGRDDA